MNPINTICRELSTKMISELATVLELILTAGTVVEGMILSTNKVRIENVWKIQFHFIRKRPGSFLMI